MPPAKQSSADDTPKRLLTLVLNRLVREYLAPRLRANLYRGSGRRFRRERDRVLSLLRVEQRSSSGSDAIHFSSAFGAFVPGFGAILDGRTGEGTIHETGAPEPQFFGHVGGDTGPAWIELSVHMSDDQVADIGRSFAERHEQHVLPWLDQFQSPKDVARFLEGPMASPNKWTVNYHTSMDDRLRRAAACHFVAGDDAACLAAIERALVECPRSRHYAALQDFDRRLRDLIRERQEQGALPPPQE